MRSEGKIYISTCMSCSAPTVSYRGSIADTCCDDTDYDYESFDYTSEQTGNVLEVHTCSICSHTITIIPEMSDDDDDDDSYHDDDDDDDDSYHDDDDDDDDDYRTKMCPHCNREMDLVLTANIINTY